MNGKKKLDMSKIICYLCNEPGHFANQCPNRNKDKKKVTFESAHVTKQEDEACRTALEFFNNLSKSCCCCCDNEIDSSDDAADSQEVLTNSTPADLRSIDMSVENVDMTLDTVTTEEDEHINQIELNARPSSSRMHSVVDFITSGAYEIDSDGNDITDNNQLHISQNNSLNESNQTDVSPTTVDLYQAISRDELVSTMMEITNGNYAFATDQERENWNSSTTSVEGGENNGNFNFTIASSSTSSPSSANNAHAAFAARIIDRSTTILPTGDFARWLLDSGATSHFTPVFSDLIDPTPLVDPIYIRVADGSRMRASHQGIVELHFISDEGANVNLRLLRVLFVPGLQTRLFSIESFISNGRFTALYLQGRVRLQFSPQISITIELPHIPPGSYIANSVRDIDNIHPDDRGFNTTLFQNQNNNNNNQDGDQHFMMMAREISNDTTTTDPMQGGVDGATWKPSNWSEKSLSTPNKQRMNVELAHKIFGHRAISSLMAASKSNVWDDITLDFAGDTWCDKCKIAVAPRQAISKRSMRMNGLPLQHIFIDCIPCPGILAGVAECRDKDFYFLCCPNSKFVTKINAPDKSSSTAIKLLSKWRGEMLEKGFKTILYLDEL